MAIGDTGTFTDPRDGQVYPWKIMKDGKKWMTKNLNFKSAHARCYDDKEANALKYGRLYNYKEAKTVSPEGWRLPKLEDYDGLELACGYNSERGYEIFKEGGSSGFNAKLGGILYLNEDNDYQLTFGGMGKSATFWVDSNTGYIEPSLRPWKIWINKPPGLSVHASSNQTEGCSVRCVQVVS